MKLLKVVFFSLVLAIAPMSFSQSGGAGGSSASGAAGSLSTGVIAAIAAAVLAVAAIVDAQDGDKVTAPAPLPPAEAHGPALGQRSAR